MTIRITLLWMVFAFLTSFIIVTGFLGYTQTPQRVSDPNGNSIQKVKERYPSPDYRNASNVELGIAVKDRLN